MGYPSGQRPVKAAALMLSAALLLVLGFSSGAGANIYTYTDEGGVVHFTNMPVDARYRVYLREPDPPPPPAAPPAEGQKEQRWDEHIINCAARNAVEPAFLKAVMKVESDFNPTATSVDGALGLMQLMPETAERLGVQNPFNPRDNIEGAARHIANLIRQFGSPPLAAAAYNAGEKAVEKYGGIPPYPETRKYVKDVIREYDAYRRTGFGSGTGEQAQNTPGSPRERIYAVRHPDGFVIYTNMPWLYQEKDRP